MKKLELHETFSIGEFKFTVAHTGGEYYLNCRGENNDKIFDKHHIEKYALQERTLGYRDSRGAFPYCRSLEDLTMFADAIQKTISGGSISRSEPEAFLGSSKTFKMGDTVLLDGLKHHVSQGSKGYYLSGFGERIFNNNGLNKTELQKQTLGYQDTEGIFPESNTLEDLTRFVAAIQEASQSKFKPMVQLHSNQITPSTFLQIRLRRILRLVILFYLTCKARISVTFSSVLRIYMSRPL